MILAHPEISTVLDTGKDRIQSLVIENRAFLRSFLQDLQDQIDGKSGKTVLSDSGKPLELVKYMEIIDHFIPFSLNRKTLLSRLCTMLETESNSEDYYLLTQSVLQQVETYILTLSLGLPVEIDCTKLSVSSLLKSAGIEIVSAHEETIEQIIDYMGLMRDLERDKLFLLVNLRSYFSDPEVEAFLQTMLDHRFHVILLDSYAGQVLQSEERLTIDDDLCEF